MQMFLHQMLQPLLRINVTVSERPFIPHVWILFKGYFSISIYSELLVLREGNTDYGYTVTDTFLVVLLLVKYSVEHVAD